MLTEQQALYLEEIKKKNGQSRLLELCSFILTAIIYLIL